MENQLSTTESSMEDDFAFTSTSTLWADDVGSNYFAESAMSSLSSLDHRLENQFDSELKVSKSDSSLIDGLARTVRRENFKKTEYQKRISANMAGAGSPKRVERRASLSGSSLELDGSSGALMGDFSADLAACDATLKELQKNLRASDTDGMIVSADDKAREEERKRRAEEERKAREAEKDLQDPKKKGCVED